MRSAARVLKGGTIAIGIVFIFLLAAARAAVAQSIDGRVTGVVIDATGEALPDVRIAVTNTATGAERIVTTTGNGRFTAAGLQPGPYELTATRAGFSMRRQEQLQITPGRTTALVIELGTAADPETITVGPAPPLIERAETGTMFFVSRPAYDHLPLRERNPADAAATAPGVTRDFLTGDSAIEGQPSSMNRVASDGGDSDVVSDSGFGARLGAQAPYELPQHAVDRAQVLLNAYSAEYGRTTAGAVNLVTRAGSNEFVATAFTFQGNKAMTGSPLLNTAAGLGKGDYRDEQFGALASGALVSDRHFALVAFDRVRHAATNAVALRNPSTTGTTAATRGLDRLLPLAESWIGRRGQDLFLVRTDHRLSSDHRVMLRYTHQAYDGTEGAGLTRAGGAASQASIDGRSFQASVGSTFTPALVNDLRVRYQRSRAHAAASSTHPAAEIRQEGTLVLRTGRDPFSSRESDVDRVQIADTAVWAAGAHTLTTGFDLLMDTSRMRVPGAFSGAYVFQSLSGFGDGRIGALGDSYTQAFALPGSRGATTHPDSRELAAFVQSEWRAGRSTTVSAGLRYDLQRLAAPGGTTLPALAARGYDTTRLPQDTNNWGPRLGIAWSRADARLVFRGGYGLVYGHTPATAAASAAAYNGVDLRVARFTGSTASLAPPWPGRLGDLPQGALTPPSDVFVFDPAFAQARSHQASAGIEWEWMPHIAIGGGYLHLRGDHLPQTVDVNVGVTATATVPLTGSTEVLSYRRVDSRGFGDVGRLLMYQSVARSRYDGVYATLTRRFAQGSEYRLAYTLSRAIDTGPDATAVFPGTSDDRRMLPFDAAGEFAPGNDDRRHRMAISFVYLTDAFAARQARWIRPLLRNWTFSGVWTAQSGAPFSAYVDADLNRDGNGLNDLAPGTSRNQYRLLGNVSFDPRLARHVSLGSGRRLTFAWQAFNLLNRPNYTAANDVLYVAGANALQKNPLFGRPVAQANPRIMHVGVVVEF